MGNMELFAFLDGWNDDDLSDGAWLYMLQEGVRAWNEQNNQQLDPHNTVMKYLQWRSKSG